MEQFPVIGVSARGGVGKDYITENFLYPGLSKHKRTLILCLADHLKVDVVAKDKVDHDKVFGDTRDAETRRLLQRRGTEEGRQVYGDDVWIRVLKTWMRRHMARGIELFIVPDVRFINEAQAIRDMGGIVIRLEAPKRNRARFMKEAKGDEKLADSLMQHISETELAGHPELFDFIVPNDVGEEEQSRRAITDIVANLDTNDLRGTKRKRCECPTQDVDSDSHAENGHSDKKCKLN